MGMLPLCLFLTHWDRHVSDDISFNDVMMGTIASQITSLRIVYSIIYSDADQRKLQSSASLAFVRGIHRGPVNSPHKWPVKRKMFTFDDVIMFKRIFFNGTIGIVIKNCLRFVAKLPIDNKPAFVEVMASRRTGDKPLIETIMAWFTDALMRYLASVSCA